MKKNIYIIILIIFLLSSCNFNNDNENVKINTNDKIIVNEKINQKLNNNLEEGFDSENNISETGSILEVNKGEQVVGIKLSGELFENCNMIFGNQPDDLLDCKITGIVNNDNLKCSDLNNLEYENKCIEIIQKIDEYKKIVDLEKVYNKYYEEKLF